MVKKEPSMRIYLYIQLINLALFKLLFMLLLFFIRFGSIQCLLCSSHFAFCLLQFYIWMYVTLEKVLLSHPCITQTFTKVFDRSIFGGQLVFMLINVLLAIFVLECFELPFHFNSHCSCGCPLKSMLIRSDRLDLLWHGTFFSVRPKSRIRFLMLDKPSLLFLRVFRTNPWGPAGCLRLPPLGFMVSLCCDWSIDRGALLDKEKQVGCVCVMQVRKRSKRPTVVAVMHLVPLTCTDSWHCFSCTWHSLHCAGQYGDNSFRFS